VGECGYASVGDGDGECWAGVGDGVGDVVWFDVVGSG